MSWKTRVGTVLLTAAVWVLLPSEAEAQRGGGGFWDWIHEISGPRVYGGGGFIEFCLKEHFYGEKKTFCTDQAGARQAAIDAQRGALSEGLATYFRIGIGYMPFTSGDGLLDEAEINKTSIFPSVQFVTNTHPNWKAVFGVGVRAPWAFISIRVFVSEQRALPGELDDSLRKFSRGAINHLTNSDPSASGPGQVVETRGGTRRKSRSIDRR